MPSITENQIKQITFPIQGMSCVSCAARIEKIIGQMEGIYLAQVNFGSESASIKYEAGQVSTRDISETIEKLGFTVPSLKEDSLPQDFYEERYIQEIRQLKLKLTVSVLISILVLAGNMESIFPVLGMFFLPTFSIL